MKKIVFLLLVGFSGLFYSCFDGTSTSCSSECEGVEFCVERSCTTKTQTDIYGNDFEVETCTEQAYYEINGSNHYCRTRIDGVFDCSSVMDELKEYCGTYSKID